MYIKRGIIILIIAVIAGLNGYSQEILSNEASYRVEYSYYYKRDSTKTGYLMDTYFLDICKSGHSFFYSRITQYRDSVKQASLAQGMDAYQASEVIRSLPRGLVWYIDKRYADRKVMYYTQLVWDVFRGIGELELPKWEIVGDTTILNGFTCNKAIGVAGGREWIVWYTPDIQLNEGPWLLWGLPGLILKAEDSTGCFKFICDNVGELASPYYVLLSGDYNNTRSMDLDGAVRAETMYELDPKKFMSVYGFGEMQGPPIPKRYYIPLYLVK